MFKRERSTLESLTREILSEPKLRKKKWDHLFVWVEFRDGVTNESGFVYKGDDWDWAGVGDPELNTLTLFEQLRAETAEQDERGPFDACLFRLHNGSKEPDLTYLWGAEADEWRITPVTSMDVMEKARPR